MLVENPRKKQHEDSLFSHNKKIPESLLSDFPKPQETTQQKPLQKVSSTADVNAVNKTEKIKIKQKVKLVPASTFRRVCAFIINISVFSGLFFFGVYYHKVDTELSDLFSHLILAFWILQLILMMFLGRTLGKLLMNIRVVSSVTKLKISSCRYMLREILDMLAIVSVIPLFINGGMIIFGRKRSLSDMLLSSMVVQPQVRQHKNKRNGAR